MSDSAWPGLGFNPAKGNPTTVQWLSHDVGRVGDELQELHGLLQSLGTADGAWKGEAATAFRAKLDKLPGYLRQGSESMHDCSRALKQWHHRLTEYQHQAKGLERDAVEARARVKRTHDANERVNDRIRALRTSHAQLTQAEADRITAESHAAVTAANDAVRDLEAIIKRAEKLRKDWERHAEEAGRAIRKAAKNRPPDIGVWEKLSGKLSGAWKGFKDFLVEHADLFSTISSGLAVAALAVNAIPVAGQLASGVLGTASVAFAGAALAGHAIGAYRGDTPAWKMGLDALGVIPGGKAIWAGAKASKAMPTVFAQSTRMSRAWYGGMEGLAKPISTGLINKGLGYFAKPLPPSLVTMGVKSFATGFGVGHMAFGGGGHGGGEGRSSTSSRATPTAFHHALAA
ncbi:WXG100 family type VII secretion target [Streptomyces mobaraensis]|uniref:WXG100 family type VII secretion target n=1 Tax=Streptomyces mobaraensis TaxID=35621 RepID=UPI003401C753